jgi:hypothetical protein
VTCIGQTSRVGIPDEESWFRRSYLPTGRALGWRRVCLTILVAILLIGAIAVVIFGVAAGLS